MVNERISLSHKESSLPETSIKRISESERLRIMAQKVKVILTREDFLTDIDCNFNNIKTKTFDKAGCHDMGYISSSCQKVKDSVDLAEESDKESDTLEVSGIKSPSNGFSPVNFYGSRKKTQTPSIKLFTLDAQEMLTNKHDNLGGKNSPSVKRKYKKQSSSSGMKKKQKTGNVARQGTPSGDKKQGGAENCSHVLEREYLVDEPLRSDVLSENKAENIISEMVVAGSSEEAKCSCVVPAGSSSGHGSEGSLIGAGTDKFSLISNNLLSSPGEAESISSEASLCSGPGPLRASLFLRKHGNEYFFANSTESDNNSQAGRLESSEIMENGLTQSTANGSLFSGPCCTQLNDESLIETPAFTTKTDDSPSSLSFSTSSSPDTSENGIMLKLLGRDTDSSSAKSSPEHQVPITKYFRSVTGLRSGTKSAANGISSSRMSSTERSPDIKSRVTPLRKKRLAKKQEQMYLDLGQKDFGHVTCPTCGMVYTRAQPDDEAAHIRHHKSFISGLRFAGWKNECVIKEYHDGRVIMVGPDAHPLHLKKVGEVRKVVDSELGFVVDVPSGKYETKTFLFISARKVVGCALAVQIDQGYPVLPSPGEASTPEKQIAAWCCSTTPQLAQCGISRIWVHSQHRRKKVATRLLDCVRTNFIYGCIIPRELVAFSDPTPDGKRLAKSYTGTAQFLVFR